ncbi:AraC family transcriptional regulator [Noviherbaspirillum aridicola]|uniref:AraC family transcriptional regulator n=1 Tax=Noviherbaspirillum aridicola TaxID=2849687 RepID=A0ABQ4QAA0_9BURK|nr:helix-turn-helix transcriptional regulator [Noviherbaspirillum aridicola]GIZ53979.1 AraC family transcriptional regulator [Noviherbaspirillum aridicola]
MPVQPVRHTRPNLPGRSPSSERPVRVVARDLAAAELLAAHSHEWGQITYALDGVIRVTAADTTWIVPPQRAIWIPPHAVHEVSTLEPTRLRALYIHARAAPFGGRCEVLEVSTLLRELVLALVQSDAGDAREELVMRLILNELPRLATLPIRVPLPRDKRLKALCEALIADPALPLTLGAWADRVGASERTLARLFERELGMSFGQWRQQVRLAHAAPLIAAGMPLSQVAAELGYASQSAFSAMFRKTFGKSPSVFFGGATG